MKASNSSLVYLAEQSPHYHDIPGLEEREAVVISAVPRPLPLCKPPFFTLKWGCNWDLPHKVWGLDESMHERCASMVPSILEALVGEKNGY